MEYDIWTKEIHDLFCHFFILLTMFDSNDIQILTDVLVVKIL